MSVGSGGKFGFTDIISSVLKEDAMSLDNWHEYNLKRHFTVRCIGKSFS